MPDSHRQLAADVVACRRCPRLRRHCEAVAASPRRAFAGQRYWGLPVPSSGGSDARLWIVGLAPAAHGANRTGRMFTGDRSGDFLYAALHRAGFASAPASTARDDGTRLLGCGITAIVRCAPPDNRPTPRETANCRSYLAREWELLRELRVVLALGGLAYKETLRLFAAKGLVLSGAPRPPPFGHGLELASQRPRGARRDAASSAGGPAAGRERAGPVLLTSYHVSQQNTFTGRLTPAMLDAVLRRARRLADR